MRPYLYKDLYELEEKHWWHISKRRIILKLISKYISIKNPKILDIGCGTGKNVEVFSKIGQAWGIDNSPLAIKFCKKRGLKNIRLGTAENTKFPADTFDIITLLDVLEHSDDKKIIKEVKRILKKHRFLILTVPALPQLWSNWDVVLHHKRRYTKNSLINLFNQNEFKLIRISYMYSFLVLPTIIIRTIKNILYPKNYPSDFRLSNPLLNFLLDKISTLESSLVINFSVPVGLSLIAILEKMN